MGITLWMHKNDNLLCSYVFLCDGFCFHIFSPFPTLAFVEVKLTANLNVRTTRIEHVVRQERADVGKEVCFMVIICKIFNKLVTVVEFIIWGGLSAFQLHHSHVFNSNWTKHSASTDLLGWGRSIITPILPSVSINQVCSGLTICYNYYTVFFFYLFTHLRRHRLPPNYNQFFMVPPRTLP